jgi:hypothetical protein
MRSTLEKIVRHDQVSLFGVRYRGGEFIAECVIGRGINVTSVRGTTPEAAIEALWAIIAPTAIPVPPAPAPAPYPFPLPPEV